MKILIVKMSSMGDVIHCLPAVTDLLNHLPDAEVDWVVEQGFEDIVKLHPGISRVIPVSIRQWRRNWLKNRSKISAFRKNLTATPYDLVLDAQGLIKSAIVAKMAHGTRAGFDHSSAREPLAAMFYKQKVSVEKGVHAIERQRKLFAGIFNYEYSAELSYGLGSGDPASSSILFFHGTTWASKHWPDENWLELAKICEGRGFKVKLPGLSEAEQKRANWIAELVPGVEVMPPGSLNDLVTELRSARGVVSVDTGLGHLATALDVPLVGLYGPTSPALTGFNGPRQISLNDAALPCAPCINAQCQYKESDHLDKIYPPCFNAMTAQHVFEHLEEQLNPTR